MHHQHKNYYFPNPYKTSNPTFEKKDLLRLKQKLEIKISQFIPFYPIKAKIITPIIKIKATIAPIKTTIFVSEPSLELFSTGCSI